jgi:nucleoside phosphorylase
MVDLAIFAALAWERATVASGLSHPRPAGHRAWRAGAGTHSCFLIQTGMGPERARQAAMASPPTRSMLVWGCAGGLVPECAPGTILVANRVVDDRGAEWDVPLATPLASWAAEHGLPVRQGTLLTTAEALVTRDAKRHAAARGAVAVDMEAAAIVQVAAQRRLPVAVVRVVLDGVDDALPPPSLVDTSSGDIRLLAAARYFSLPTRWSDAIRLSARQRLAARSLCRFAGLLLGGPGGSLLDLFTGTHGSI